MLTQKLVPGRCPDVYIPGQATHAYILGYWHLVPLIKPPWAAALSVARVQTSAPAHPPTKELLLASLMSQYHFARCRLSATVVCNAAGVQAGLLLGTWVVRLPTLHGGPVWLCSIRATPFK